jgi:hypothetical protein
VNDTDLAHLLEDVRTSMACPRKVEIREAPDLTAPATAGWWNAVVLLPADWRSWGCHERRAVGAHELAHICRNDYLAGIVARVASALHFYHPLVYWLAARLHLEQELAADALGARFAGGRVLYLQCLSRLALRQDGRLPCWPAREFLPPRGTLIRRIAMLREESNAPDRPRSGPRLALAALLLLGVAAGASMLRGPARANDPGGPTASQSQYVLGEMASADTVRSSIKPIDLSYVTEDDTQGIVVFRPAAAFRRSSMGVYRTMLNGFIREQWAKAAGALKFDPTQPGQKPLAVDLFEQVTASVRIYRAKGPKPNGRLAVTMFTVRTTEPVDWLALCRLFRLEITELRDGDLVYYRVRDTPLAPEIFFFCPDDRTLVLTGEEIPAVAEQLLLKHLRRPTPPPAPVFAQGKDWNRFLHGLFVVALDNRGGRLEKPLRGDGPEDEDFDLMFSLVEHIDLWALGLDDDDQIVFRGVGTCPDGGASASTARAIGGLLNRARKEFDTFDAKTAPRRAGEEKAYRMARAFLKNMRVDREGHSVLVRSSGLGTIADFVSLIADGVIN